MAKRILSLFFAAVLLLSVSALAEENLLKNGDFSIYKEGFPENWTKSMWYTDEGVSELTVTNDGYEGSDPCITVENHSVNDARYQQTVAVKPGTTYRIACMVRAEGLEEGTAGANISIENTFVRSEAICNTDGAWQLCELYGTTGDDQTSLTVYARVGGYSSEVTGKASFDNFTMEEVTQLPEGILPTSFATAAPSEKSGDAAGEKTEPERRTQTYVLFTFIMLLIGVAVACKSGSKPERDAASTEKLFYVMMVLALLVRVVFAATVPGYNTDINCFTSWAGTMFSAGPLHFYETISWCDYPPLYMLLLWPVGALQALLHCSMRSAPQLLLIKLWPIVFDLLAAALLYSKGKKQIGARAALLLSAFFVFNPAILTNSVLWGQIDSAIAFFLVMCVLYACENRCIPSLAYFALALLTKPQALLFGPIGLVYLVGARVRSSQSSAQKRKAWLDFVLGVVTALLILAAAAFIFAPDKAHAISWLIGKYKTTTQGYNYVTVNTLNLWVVFDKNWAMAESNKLCMLAAWTLIVMSYAYCIVLMLRSKSRKALPLIGGTLLVLVCTFGPMMHERYIYPALLLLLLAYINERDTRLLACIGVLSATLFLNEILVLQGGMTEANFGHLQSKEQTLNVIISLINVVNAIVLACVCLDIAVFRRRVNILPNTPAVDEAPRIEDYKMHLRPRDFLLMAAVTLVYAVVAFVNLGDMDAPETYWQSGSENEEIVFDLGQTEAFRMIYYGNICDSNFTVQLSNDAENWTEPVYAQYAQGQIFRWLYFVPCDAENKTLNDETEPTDDGKAFVVYATADEKFPYQRARYVRIESVSAGLKLCEIGFLNEIGKPLPVVGTEQNGTNVISPASNLLDEQDTVPSAPSYMNSTYFDEIYHARTAYEHLHGLPTYEWTHPPLGKVLMMVGVKLFGMTPFGWRFMGTLVGVLMLPLMYLMVKQLTKSTTLSFIAMFLMSVDSMHFTQTRIATIDSYSVFWIMLMYLFMFRFMQMPWTDAKSYRRSLRVLGLCGMTMGVAWATKWIGIYASAGLAVLFFARLFMHLRARSYACAHPEETELEDARKNTARRIVLTLLFCVVFFVMIPVLIYYFSYYWHLQSLGVTCFKDMFSMEHIRTVIDLQKRIFGYHNGLGGDTHFFRSPWYEWPIIAKPMWYFSGNDYIAPGMVSSISCMGNPAVWWFGLASIIATAVLVAVRRKADRAQAIVLTSFASQFLPWILIVRSTFIYHYFASVPFIIIASVLMLDEIRKKNKAAFKAVAVVLMAAALFLFIMFYPLESGMIVPRGYAMLLRWFKWYNFAL